MQAATGRELQSDLTKGEDHGIEQQLVGGHAIGLQTLVQLQDGLARHWLRVSVLFSGAQVGHHLAVVVRPLHQSQ